MLGFHPLGNFPLSTIALKKASSGVRRLRNYFFKTEEKQIKKVEERKIEIVQHRELLIEEHDDKWEIAKELNQTSAEYEALMKELNDLIEAINRLENRERRIKVYIDRKKLYTEQKVKQQRQKEEKAILLLLLNDY
jgi:hypothetical protein